MKDASRPPGALGSRREASTGQAPEEQKQKLMGPLCSARELGRGGVCGPGLLPFLRPAPRTSGPALPRSRWDGPVQGLPSLCRSLSPPGAASNVCSCPRSWGSALSLNLGFFPRGMGREAPSCGAVGRRKGARLTKCWDRPTHRGLGAWEVRVLLPAVESREISAPSHLPA